MLAFTLVRFNMLGLGGGRVTGVAGALCLAAVAAAQEVPGPRVRPLSNRFRVEIGGALAGALPRGEFHDFVRSGYGFTLFASAGFGRAATAGLRLDFALIEYGRETQRVPLSQTVQRILVDVTTRNDIVSLGLGPELALGGSRLRLYAYGGIGFARFATTSSVSGSGDQEDFATSTNYHDVTFERHAGAGLRVWVTRMPVPVGVEFGTRYMHNGRTRYLKEGSIIDNPGGNPTILPIESETNLLLFHLGVSARVL